jgi:hypothetical protein
LSVLLVELGNDACTVVVGINPAFEAASISSSAAVTAAIVFIQAVKIGKDVLPCHLCKRLLVA